MYHLNKSVLSFLENLETKLNCEIRFVPSEGRQPPFLGKDCSFYEEGKIGIPLFLKEEFYGCLFISSLDLSQKSFKLLEVFIKDGLDYFLEKIGTYFYLQYLLPKTEDPTENLAEDSNVISFSKESPHLWSQLKKEPNILFVSGESKEKILQSSLKIHNLTPHVAFIHLDQLMKKDQDFTTWSNLTFTTLFLPDWKSCETWQKQQIKQFISSSKSPLPPRIIIGLKGETAEWKIS